MQNIQRMIRQIWLPMLAVFAGAGISSLSPGNFWMGWFSAGVLLFVCVFFLQVAWRWAGSEKMVAWMLVLAFILRLGLGVGLSQALPVFGYDEEVPNAGYIFYDAYHRDRQAWQLAQSGESLRAAFGETYSMDQYGGLMATSAAIYRLLSPDAMRPLLMIILTAFAGSVGLPFLWKALLERWGRRVALSAAWIFGLYPEAILLGASQMREPFLLGLSSIAFWAVASLVPGRKGISSVTVLAASLGLMMLFSWRAALPIAGMLAIWYWVEKQSQNRSWRVVGWVVLALGGIAATLLAWGWLRDAAAWDALLTEQNSGMIQRQLEQLPVFLHLPFLTGYGLLQPVLPAAVIETALPIHKLISVFKSAGWYLLVPVLIYVCFAIFRAQPAKDRSILLWTLGISMLWVVISSLRAGGDQWDNPRYRTMFLVWLSLLAGWGWNWARSRRDPWLGRWYLVMGIFLTFFTQWYLSRYYPVGGKLPFFTMVAISAGVIFLFLVGCLIRDRKRRARKISE